MNSGDAVLIIGCNVGLLKRSACLNIFQKATRSEPCFIALGVDRTTRILSLLESVLPLSSSRRQPTHLNLNYIPESSAISCAVSSTKSDGTRSNDKSKIWSRIMIGGEVSREISSTSPHDPAHRQVCGANDQKIAFVLISNPILLGWSEDPIRFHSRLIPSTAFCLQLMLMSKKRNCPRLRGKVSIQILAEMDNNT